MNLEGFIDLAAGLPLDAVELTAYYFPKPRRVTWLGSRGACTRLGLDISGTAIGNNFCNHRSDAACASRFDHAKRWIEHTSRLGGKTVRIFAGTVEAGDTEENARRRCVDAIGDVCTHAADFGVYVALEKPRRASPATADQMLGPSCAPSTATGSA